MNPVVLGALIGAIPGTIAAALATWASVRAGKLAAEQVRLAQVTEHATWLRDKRSDVYVEGIRFLHQASVWRQELIRSGAAASLLHDQVRKILDSYGELPWHDRLARAEAYLPGDASSLYLAAAEDDWAIWRFVQESLTANDEQDLVITDQLAEDLKRANIAFREFRDLARRDLLTPPLVQLPG